ncbi:DEAD/DEAH box helicase [Bacillus thuringiensis]|uniref:DEAD/DEAH box helicase n=1 Tax=Bacillus thuringiensis TaxID=1428 RepID=UPI00399B4C1A
MTRLKRYGTRTPMDRLLCGDVGYGKTEVAIRAAFKAIMDEKQVAILVPTTILRSNTMKQFESVFKIINQYRLISRFRTRKQTK